MLTKASKRTIIGFCIIGMIVLLFTFGKPYKPEAPALPVQGEIYSEEALAIRDALLSKNRQYSALENEQREDAAEMARAEKRIQNNEAAKMQIAVDARAYDRILCSEFGLEFVRPAGTGSGYLKTATGSCVDF